MNELRLHLAEDRRKMESPDDVALALVHKNEINSDPHKWAALEILQFEHYRVVRLDIGAIHTDGTKERAIVSRHYSINDGEVVITIQVHP